MNIVTNKKNQVYRFGKKLSPQISPYLSSLHNLSITKFLLLAVPSCVIWFIISRVSALSVLVSTVYQVVLLAYSFLLLLQRKKVDSLIVIYYLAVLQPAFRQYSAAPFLILEYVFPFWVLLFLLASREFEVTLPLVFYGVYLVLEAAGLFLAKDVNISRGIFVSSFTLGLVLLLSSVIKFNDKEIRKIFVFILIAITNLLALVMLPYIVNSSSISWRTSSNFVASGNMGPVQISMLLAVGAFICTVLADFVNLKGKKIFFLESNGDLYIFYGTYFFEKRYISFSNSNSTVFCVFPTYFNKECNLTYSPFFSTLFCF